MRSRGYSLRGRTAFSLYRFDNRDRSLVVVIFALLITILAGAALDQTHIYYDPRIIMMPATSGPSSGLRSATSTRPSAFDLTTTMS